MVQEGEGKRIVKSSEEDTAVVKTENDRDLDKCFSSRDGEERDLERKNTSVSGLGHSGEQRRQSEDVARVATTQGKEKMKTECCISILSVN